MSVFFVTAVKIDGGEVESAEVRQVGLSGAGHEGEFNLRDGKMLDRAALASLTISDTVYVGLFDRPGYFKKGHRVSRKAGQMEFPVSVDDDGKPSSELLDLPKIN